MTRWEFTYVGLWLGYRKDMDAVDNAKQAIAKLGSDGWEPVGQISFMYQAINSTVETRVTQLMFKRPIT